MIPIEAMQASINHALAAYPEEAVGYVSEDKYFPLYNVAVEPTIEFAINCTQSLQVYSEATCLIHSHTDGMNFPSDHDMRSQEEMDMPWCVLVLDTAEGKPYFRDAFWLGLGSPMAPYVGREFRHGTADCYSLVRDWYWQERQIRLPTFPRTAQWWVGDDDLISENFAKAGFVEVLAKNAEIGDVVAMSIGGSKVNHLGVYIGDGVLLHHLAGRVSTTESVIRWANHTSGKFLRYVGA